MMGICSEQSNCRCLWGLWAAQYVSIVIFDGFPGSLVNDRLPMVATGTFLSLVGTDGHAAELDTLDDCPGFGLSRHDFHAVKSCLGESLQELMLHERPADAAAP